MKGNVTVGHPIDVATGAMHNTYMDISIPGKVDLTWGRFYSTALINSSGAMGAGWTNRYFCTLSYLDGKYCFIDAQGAETVFSDLDNSLKKREVVRDFGAFTELRWRDNRFIVTQWDVDSGEIHDFVFKTLRDGEISPLQEINDVTGQGLEFAYDQQSRLVGIRQKLEKRTLILSYSSAGVVEQIEFLSSDKKIRHTLVTYGYDFFGQLTTISDALGNKDNFQYDRDNRIVLEQGKDGSEFSFKYDKKGRCIRSEGIDGYDHKTLKYLENAQWTEVTDSLGNVRRFHHNADGQVLREINPLGAEYQTEYDEYGRIQLKTNPVGAITRYEYDDFGNRSKIINALGEKTEFEYNSFRLPTSYTNAAGSSWFRYYDSKNRLIGTTDSEGNSYHYKYNRHGSIAEVVNPVGDLLCRNFDAKGVLTAIIDWEGNKTRYRADEFGRLIEVIDPLDKCSCFMYDLMHNLTQIEYPDGTRCIYTYDSGRNLTKLVNRNGETTKFKYGSCSRLVERIDSIGRITYFRWGSEPARLEAVINAKKEIYKFNYNANGWVVSETGFDGRKLEYEYDQTGGRITIINGLGDRVEYERDILGRLIGLRSFDDNSASFSYNAAGFLESAVNEHSMIEFTRNSLGQVVRESQNGYVLERQFDQLGNQIQLKSEFGMEFNCRFDGNGFLATCQVDDHTPINFNRDARGSETSRSLSGFVNMSNQYDSMGRLASQTVVRNNRDNAQNRHESLNELVRRSYRYDKAQLVSIDDNYRGSSTYVYDPAERLVQTMRSAGVSENFQYDDNDNITRIDTQEHSTHLHYTTGDRLVCTDGCEYFFDLHGRLNKKIQKHKDGRLLEWSFEWDSLDQLRTVTNPKGEVWHYVYDPFGRRIEKVSPTGEKCGFVWDHGVIVHELLDGVICSSWAFDPHSFRPLCKIEKNELYNVITDHLGTPQEMVDRLGEIVWQVRYNSWGKVTEWESREIDCPIRFQGQWHDEETGLYYNRFRYYDPSIGRYISSDPVRLRGGKNLFRYVKNPIAWIDPFGLVCENDDNDGNGYVAYHITDENGEVVYVGMTQADRFRDRQQEHIDSGRLTDDRTMAPVVWAETYGEIRGIEQAHIDHHGTRNTDHIGNYDYAENPGNRINSVSEERINNPSNDRERAFQSGRDNENRNNGWGN